MAEFTNEKILPQNLEAEQAVLAAMFNDKDAILEVIPLLKESDFYRHDHAVLYSAMRAMNEKGIPIDLITITDELEKAGNLEKAGGISYIAQIANGLGSGSNIAHYAKIVREKAILRALIQVSGNITNRSYDDTETTEAILDDAEKMVLEISQNKSRSDLTVISDVIGESLDRLEMLSKNIGFEDEEVMWLYTSLFTDVKIAPPSYTLDMLLESLGAEDASIQANKKAVKIFLNDNGDYAMAYRASEDSEFIHRVEIVVADKLIRKDYFTYCKIFTEYYAPLNGKAHLYMRRFFNEDGTVAYDEITDDESVVFKFSDNIFYSKEELIAEFVRRLKLTSEDLVIVDRTTGMGQSIIQNARPAKIGIVIHADHFSEGNTNDDNILWNNYYEYSFTNNSKIDFYIASTEAQKELVQEQFKKYNGVCPEVFAIPVGSVDELKYSDNRKRHSVITASRLAGEKHIEWIVDAVVEARKTIEDITLPSSSNSLFFVIIV